MGIISLCVFLWDGNSGGNVFLLYGNSQLCVYASFYTAKYARRTFMDNATVNGGMTWHNFE